MRIEIERSGGLAGLTEAVLSVETEGLPPARRDEARRAALRLESSSAAHPRGPGADLIVYRVALTDRGRPRQFTLEDEGLPDQPPMSDLRALLALFGAR